MTSLPLEELALGEAGRRHVRLRLEQARSLSRSVLAALPDGTGDPTAIVPAATELERALRFEEGGLLRTDVSRRALESILDPPMASPGAVFVAEDPLRRCSDPALARERTSLSCFHDEVYWWTAHAAEIPQVIRAGAAYSVNYFVSAASGGLGQELPETGLDELARKTSVVVISAYDDESFIIWRLRRTGSG